MATRLCVLQVAEKPSIAETIARVLSRGECHFRKGVSPACGVYEHEGTFLGQPAFFKTTSTAGHVFSIDFPSAYNNWDKTSPESLFDAPVVKHEANPKTRIPSHLAREAVNVDHVVLWLDCDREGENICFEVLECIQAKLKQCAGRKVPELSGPRQRIWRARFSSLANVDLERSFSSLQSPNKNEALSVDCRQELDLKIGCAFTRYQTHFFHGKYGDLDSKLISYGPCQTPTLFFCVERSDAIVSFQSESFYRIEVQIEVNQRTFSLEWSRGRVFDPAAARALKDTVTDIGHLVVTDVSVKEQKSSKPNALNTVTLLKLASRCLGIGPHHAMQIAERLYLSGLITYPRTETSRYPDNFDLRAALQQQAQNPVWGAYASSLLQGPLERPKGGTDVGDHPPITPIRSVSPTEAGGGDAWRVYQLITCHFLATLSKDCVFIRTKVTFKGADELFYLRGKRIIVPGYTAILAHRGTTGDLEDDDNGDTYEDGDNGLEEENVSDFRVGDVSAIKEVALSDYKTSPPKYLSEAELLGLMERHGIGTDASMPSHINNICERNFVELLSGRRLKPTKLGIALVHGYLSIDPELVLPSIRAQIESQCNLIAKGKADKDAVLHHALTLFKKKFLFFQKQIALVDSLFETRFTPLAQTGQPLSRCGVCRRYMKVIRSRLNRLYCGHCEVTYNLPNSGVIKLYKGLTCPLDGFELLICVHKDSGRAVPICPMCYNDPPFAGQKRSALTETASLEAVGQNKMTCLQCEHPSCQNSLKSQGVCFCPQEHCDGTLCLDVISAPNWKLICNTCPYQLEFKSKIHKVVVQPEHRCEACGCNLIDVTPHKTSVTAPSHQEGVELPKDVAVLSGCIVCSPDINSMLQSKLAKLYVGRRGRVFKGRGRGRRGGRRGKRGNFDPKMSFDYF